MSHTHTSRPLFIAVTSILAGALLLSGCSSSGSSPGSSSVGEESSTEGGKVDLVMYYPVAVGGPLTEVVDGLIAECTAENPNISVEAVYSGGYGETITKAQTAARAGDGPDFAVLATSELFTLLDQDLIVPLGDIADVEWANDRFYTAFLESGVDAEGNLWSVPFQRSVTVQYYNKDIFAKAGLDPESPPSTWEELTAMSKQIVDSGAAEYGIQIPSTPYGYWLFQALAVQAGTEITDGSGAKTMFDDPDAIKAMEYWKTLADQGLMPSGATEWSTTPEDFFSGRTAMMWTSTGNLTNVRNNAPFSFGVSQMPTEKQGGSATGGGNIYVFKGADDAQRKAALTIAKCLTEPERTAAWSIATGYVATGQEAWETDVMKKYIEEFPQAAVPREQLDSAVVELSTHENGRVVQLVNDAINSVLVGQNSPKDGMMELQRQLDEILEPYRN